MTPDELYELKGLAYGRGYWRQEELERLPIDELIKATRLFADDAPGYALKDALHSHVYVLATRLEEAQTTPRNCPELPLTKKQSYHVGTLTIERESSSDGFPDFDLPEDAEIVAVKAIGGYHMVVQYVQRVGIPK